TYFGPVYFQDPCAHFSYVHSVGIPNPILGCESGFGEIEPKMTVGIRDKTTGGAAIAVLNLTFIHDVVSRIKLGSTGHAYVVDAHGVAIAYPDRHLVSTDLSSLPQVRSVVAGSAT